MHKWAMCPSQDLADAPARLLELQTSARAGVGLQARCRDGYDEPRSREAVRGPRAAGRAAAGRPGGDARAVRTARWAAPSPHRLRAETSPYCAASLAKRWVRLGL